MIDSENPKEKKEAESELKKPHTPKAEKVIGLDPSLYHVETEFNMWAYDFNTLAELMQHAHTARIMFACYWSMQYFNFYISCVMEIFVMLRPLLKTTLVVQPEKFKTINDIAEGINKDFMVETIRQQRLATRGKSYRPDINLLARVDRFRTLLLTARQSMGLGPKVKRNIGDMRVEMAPVAESTTDQ